MRATALALMFLSALTVTPHSLDIAYAQGGVATPAAVQELAGQNPPEYFKRADELFKAGKKDDAVFVLYLGQLRFRTYLLTHRDQDESKGPTAFATLSQVVGRPITQYAFGDVPTLARTIDAVLAYDAANPDIISSPAESADVHEDVRKGLAAMKAKMLSDIDHIRDQRAKNGLENR